MWRTAASIHWAGIAGIIVLMVLVSGPPARAAESSPPISKQTQECLNCHSMYHPGLVQDWLHSRHSQVTPSQAMTNKPKERRISSETIPDPLKGVVVGCYECHSLNATNHTDNFEHMDFRINVVVSPRDCQVCHAVEAQEFAGSKKAHAAGNLRNNPTYHELVDAITSRAELKDGKLRVVGSSEQTRNETCYGCHGTRVEVAGTRTNATDLGPVVVPSLSNWPNQGVGRVNPDGSLGACTTCHARHAFSIEVARKPFTCSQCHKGPDVPAWEVYLESKHGNIFNSQERAWNWDRVPWRVGQDFQAPTCAACHNALLTSPDGDVIAPRTHDFGARLWVRLFGLPYSHPQPKSGDTSIIRNKDRQPLPTAFTGEPAAEFLVDAKEQALRQGVMKGVCRSCHNQDWVAGHFDKLSNTILETDQMTRSATELMQKAWAQGLADPGNPFDEPIERRWTKQWLYYASSIRMGSAMMSANHTTFETGWVDLTTGLREMEEWIDSKRK